MKNTTVITSPTSGAPWTGTSFTLQSSAATEAAANTTDDSSGSLQIVVGVDDAQAPNLWRGEVCSSQQGTKLDAAEWHRIAQSDDAETYTLPPECLVALHQVRLCLLSDTSN
jgi:hypothetical protein